MKVLLFGAQGYLGRYFQQAYPDCIVANCDIADQRAVAELLDELKPDIAINAAGKTGRPNVDWCEDHKLETVHANVYGPLVLLEECSKRDVYLVHMSSGCMYDGDNKKEGFSEVDKPNFLGSFYSKSKVWSDEILSQFPRYEEGEKGVLILRLRMPFDGTQDPRNLIMKLLGYKRVLNAQNSVTYLPDFMQAAAKLIEKRQTGVYHIVNPGPISPYKIMQMYKEIVDRKHSFKRLVLKDLPQVTKAGRSNCVLSGKKLQLEGIHMQPVEDALRAAMEMLKVEKAG